MGTEARTLADHQIVAPGHLRGLGVTTAQGAGPGDDGPSRVEDRSAGECRCPDVCDRDHPNE
jgi:hypothetical protein